MSFSNLTVPLPSEAYAAMVAIIDAIEHVIHLPAYQEAILAWAPEIARFDPGTPGVFFGYDFHLSPEGPKLIEINSNAGGAALTADFASKHNWEAEYTQIFINEWRIKRGTQPLSCIAIVDEHPTTQHFYPDFLLFQQAFQKHGIHTIIADPADLWHANTPVDLVYNRLTDFALEAPAHQALRAAYLSDAIVLTPHPRAHALYADKRNLTLLSDTALLHSWGVDQARCTQLARGIPRVHLVSEAHLDTLWEMRRDLFFKPVASYGGKGVYQGAKIRRRKFDEISHADYVAQTFVPPSKHEKFKVDIRIYVYNAQPIGLIARLYQGQVTNMRTAGGGFAVVEITH